MSVNFSSDKTLSAVGEFFKSLFEGKADSIHTHSKSDISDFPSSLPANGGNADTVGGLHANEIASNPNLLINPDFRVNQRNKSGVITETGYFVDRWQLVNGTVTINSDGTLTLNGTIKQILENAVGDTTTPSASAGTASYDDSTKAFTLTAAGEIITWVKLELGLIATPFIPPDPATELVKCQRYYEKIKIPSATKIVCYKSNYLTLPAISFVNKRVIPTVSNPGNVYFVRHSDNAGIFGSLVKTSFTTYTSTQNMFYANVSQEQVNALEVGQWGYVSDGTYFEIDAEIY